MVFCENCGNEVTGNLNYKSNICQSCFKEQYGTNVLQVETVEYLGGHKDHTFNRFSAKHASGKVNLTDNSFIFTKEDKH